jgi:hypothetical protein
LLGQVRRDYCAGVLLLGSVDVLVFFFEALAAAAAEVLVLRPGLFLPRRCNNTRQYTLHHQMRKYYNKSYVPW